MNATIVVPSGHERVLDLDLPDALLATISRAAGVGRLTVAYVAGSMAEIVATQDLAGKVPTRLRKRLPAPPDALQAVRIAFDPSSGGGMAIDLPAIAPDLAEYAIGSISFDDPPDDLVAGSRTPLKITVHNRSRFQWWDGSTGVALRLDLGGAIQNLPLPESIGPGASLSIIVPLLVPDTPGPFSVACVPTLGSGLAFARGRAFPIARRTFTIVARRRRILDPVPCSIDLAVPGTHLIAGLASICSVTVRNEGAARIEASGPGGMRLRARWRREPREGTVVRDTVIAPLPYPLDPGDHCQVALDIGPPTAAGRYTLDIIADLTGDGRHARGIVSDSAPVTVELLDAVTLEKDAERALRSDLARQERRIERAAYAAWAHARDRFASPAAAAAAVDLDHWPRHPRVAVVLTGGNATTAREWLNRQPYPAWTMVEHRRGEPASIPPDCEIVLPWDQRIGHLADHALLFLAGEFLRNPAIGWVYADFDHCDASGDRHSRVFLPAPDPFFARAQPAVATVHALRSALLDDMGWTVDDLIDGNVAARLIDQLPYPAVAHLPHVLWHRHDTHEVPEAAAATAPTAADGWRMTKMHDAPGYAIRAIPPRDMPRVALIIPTRDRYDLLASCIGSIVERTDYPSYELIVVDNGSQEPETLAYLDWLAATGTARVLRDDGPFNWSRLNNRAAAVTDADLLCFLNNDMEIVSEHWLAELAALASRADVGVAGATLWFPDGTIQHGGVAFSARGSPLHPFRGTPRGEASFYLRSLRTQPAVTGACLMVRRQVFDAVGGFDELFPLGFNDIDFCMRVAKRLALPSVCAPHVELIHKESATRGRLRGEADGARFLQHLGWFEGRYLETAIDDRWGGVVAEASRRRAPATLLARKPQGARGGARRYARPGQRPIAFVHIPKTAGTSVREAFARVLPDRAVLTLGARALVEGQAGDQVTAARLYPLLANAELLVAHVSHGFGAAVGWPCDYATVLRDPIDRVRSHHGFLVEPPNAPLRDTPLADLPLAALVRRGVIPANLMLSKILGEPPETVGWPAIDGRFPRYAGFGLPPALWHGDMAALAALPEREPDRDVAKVERALAIIERDFIFVGLQDQLAAHLAAFATAIGLDTIGTVPHFNVSRRDTPLSDEDRDTVAAYNALDRMLYDAIAARPAGMVLKPR
ncbi:glycosyltransferase [Sphingomonas sp. NBWT7]|uniref:glycosyltransferase family 2 protein n=1 Tax=Sphingomonas sp. NBWT7 TaxID=2596913 RepID=UPI001627DD52|nr:glycosyltransferase family 2 protein [Sphingomonas sp. NBWT7]QNE30877.1 glycosyltransferase [Sphingomonas sp. NBWT7]